MKHGRIKLAGSTKSQISFGTINLRMLLFAIAGTTLLFASCSETSNAPQNKSAELVGESGEAGSTESVAIADLKPGPIQRDSLTDLQLERIEKIRISLSEVDTQSKEQWIENFKRDVNPDKELDVWERIVKAYIAFRNSKELNDEAKEESFKVLLLRSMLTPDDVLSQIKLNQLSESDARILMQGYE